MRFVARSSIRRALSAMTGAIPPINIASKMFRLSEILKPPTPRGSGKDARQKAWTKIAGNGGKDASCETHHGMPSADRTCHALGLSASEAVICWAYRFGKSILRWYPSLAAWFADKGGKMLPVMNDSAANSGISCLTTKNLRIWRRGIRPEGIQLPDP